MTRARIAIAATDETGAAFASVRQKLDGLNTQAAGVAATFGRLAAGPLAVVAAAAAMAKFVAGAAQSVTRLKDLQDATGGSIERLSQLTSTAARAGIDFNAVSDAVLKLNQTLASARPDSPAARLIERLGLSLSELRKQDPVDALQAVARGLAGFADDGDKARAQALLFGEGVRRIAPLLKELTGELATGATITTRQAEAFDQLSKASSRLGAQLQELAVRSAGPAVSGLARLLDLGDKAKASGFDSVFGAMLAFNTTELDRLSNLNTRLTGIVTKYREVSTLADGLRASGKLVPQELLNQLSALERQEKFLRALQKDRGGGRGDGPSGPAAPGIGAIEPEAIRAAGSQLDAYVEKLRDQLLATQSLSAEEEARISINRGLLGVLDEGARAQVLALARGLDTIRQQQSAARDSAALQAEGLSLTRSLATEQERLAEQLGRADVLLQAGAITWGTYGRLATQGLQSLTREIAAIDLPKLQQLAEPVARLSEFSAQAARNIQDVLGDTVLRTMEGNAASVLEVWRDMLRRMVAQALAAKLGQVLLGDYSATGRLGGLVGSLFSFGGARAEGGPVSAGRAYLVGERGPELVVPQAAGTVMPAGSFGGLSMVNHYSVAAGVSRGELVSALQLTQDKTKADIVAMLRSARLL